MSIKGGGVRRLMENSILNFVSRMTSLSVYILLHCLTRVEMEFCCAILQSTSGQSTAGKKISLSNILRQSEFFFNCRIKRTNKAICELVNRFLGNGSYSLTA